MSKSIKYVSIDEVKKCLIDLLDERDRRREIRDLYTHIPETMTITRAGEIIGRSYPVIKRLIRQGRIRVNVDGYVTKESVVEYVSGK